MADPIEIARQVEHFHDQHDARTVALARALLAQQPAIASKDAKIADQRDAMKIMCEESRIQREEIARLRDALAETQRIALYECERYAAIGDGAIAAKVIGSRIREKITALAPATKEGACAHRFESNHGLWDTQHRYCAKCGRAEGVDRKDGA